MAMDESASIKMFGVSSMSDYLENVKSSMTYTFAEQDEPGSGLKKIAISMLSDAQEEIRREYSEEARQTLNRVKYLLSV